MASPIEQFEIHTIGPVLFNLAGQPVSFTNSALYMLLAVLASASLVFVGMRAQALIPSRLQVLVEVLYKGMTDMVDSAAGHKSRPYFPFIFSIFIFIMFCNLLGMIPHSLTVTSHLVVNLALAMLIFCVITITGFVKHGWHFFMLFVPKGVPALLMPFLILIEVVSFLIRPFSLSIRLFANMLAGHILLKVFAGMTASLALAGGLAAVGILPLAFNIAITGFEFFVAMLQAYIFAILTSVYLHDALEMH